MASDLWHNIQKLSWAQRVDYLILFVIVIKSIEACFYDIVTRPWRIYYIITAVFSSMYCIYAVLLLMGVLDLKDFRQLAGWVVAGLFTCLMWPSVLHKVENHALKDKDPDD